MNYLRFLKNNPHYICYFNGANFDIHLLVKTMIHMSDIKRFDIRTVYKTGGCVVIFQIY